ncbi:helix-turn-helix domain-containing protein [Streptomyces sp. NPDC088258]|uniref:helix-turn-helix domain-containing protein n=1 Tax=Streptomyces sp. NPDC088258 TaxID=3365849 RepID=UPI00380F56F9
MATCRRVRRMTQADLARVSGVSLAMIRGIERGVRTPSDRTLDALADALGTDPSRLVTGGPVRMSERAQAALPALSVSIAGYDVGAEGRPGRPLDVLDTEVAIAEGRRLAAQYSRLAAGAPELIGACCTPYTRRTGKGACGRSACWCGLLARPARWRTRPRSTTCPRG